MKKIKLSGELGKGKFALIDDDDFDAMSKFTWHYGKCGYPATRFSLNGGKPRPIMMHTILLGLKEGELADHRDTNPLNNQRNNLRRCTKQQNNMNKTKSIGKSSRYKGVSTIGGKWRAQIMINNKFIHLGVFEDEINAANAYDTKAKELFGEFAKLNFI